MNRGAIYSTALLTFAEIVLISIIWASEVANGTFNLKVSTWLFIVTWRMLAYLSLCWDSVKARRRFMYCMSYTLAIEAALFVTLNTCLVLGQSEFQGVINYFFKVLGLSVEV